MAIELHTTATRETFTRWLADGRTWIGVFQNHDLGHHDVGRRIAVPFDTRRKLLGARLPLQSPAPDHLTRKTGLGPGWRYLLVAKADTVDAAIAALKEGR
jgi:hypothetical protein